MSNIVKANIPIILVIFYIKSKYKKNFGIILI